jgi:hypothetical protein
LPDDGALFPGGSVDVRARVVEDRQLQEVWYEVNGGPRQAAGYTPVAGDPSVYLTGFGVGPAALTPYIENTITIWAQDRAGLRGSDTVTFSFAPPTPTPTLNLIADDMEIIQVIQCMDNPTCSDNSVPMYVGKPTLVRLYVRAGAGAETAGIGGEICMAGVCRPSLNRVTVTASEDPVGDFRGDINRTLNFLLPSDWVASTGMRLFQVFINRDGRDIGECCFDDNSLERRFSFVTGRSLDVVMMRVRANGRTTAGEDRWPAIRWAQKYFPTSRINVYRSSDEPVSASYDYTTTDGWSSLLDDLWWSNYWTDDAVDWLRYHGMVPADIEFDSPGMGYRPGDESASVLLFRDGATTAHELGHNHGLAHAPSDRDAAGELTNPACGDPLGPNGGYPMYRAPDGGSLPRSSSATGRSTSTPRPSSFMARQRLT